MTQIVYVSVVGAELGGSAFARVKLETEAHLRASGVPWTIVRPRALHGVGRLAHPGLDYLLGLAIDEETRAPGSAAATWTGPTTVKEVVRRWHRAAAPTTTGAPAAHR